MSAELKPCPFCGGPVELERTTGMYERVHGNREWWGVVCRNTLGPGGTCAVSIRPSASEAAAVARWNNRAAPQAEPKAWTVLLLRPDYIADNYGTDTYMTTVEAATPERAVHLAQGEAIVQDFASDESARFAGLREFAEYNERDDYAVLLVIEGKHMDVKP